MKKYTTAIVFDHRGRTEREKEGPLEVRITVGRKPYYINTGIRVKSRQWAGSVVNRPDKDVLNERLAIIVQRVGEEVNAFLRDDRDVDIAKLRERVFGTTRKPGEKNQLLKWIAEQIPQLQIGSGTRKRYEVMQKRLEQYRQITEWEDLTVEKIYAWDSWLRNIKKRQRTADKQAGKEAEGITNSAVYNYHRCLRALISRAVKMGRLESNIYERMKGDFSKGVKPNVEYLTEEEMAAVMSLRPVAGTPMCVARDLFVFQLFTGLSYSDAQAFDIRNYKKVDGKWISTGERIKTGVPFVSHLLPPVVEVLERYGMQSPKIGNADYNKALKAIQMAAGITTRMHSHLARHTFATYMLKNGVKIENLAKMMGHSTIRETQKYAKVLAQSVHDEFDMIERKLTQK